MSDCITGQIIKCMKSAGGLCTLESTKLTGKNFKKGAELELKKVIEMADKMKRDRNEQIENVFCWFDNGPKS